MPTERNRPKRDCFNAKTNLPFQLRLEDFEIAMQDVYDLFYDVNSGLLEKGLERLDDSDCDNVADARSTRIGNSDRCSWRTSAEMKPAKSPGRQRGERRTQNAVIPRRPTRS